MNRQVYISGGKKKVLSWLPARRRKSSSVTISNGRPPQYVVTHVRSRDLPLSKRTPPAGPKHPIILVLNVVDEKAMLISL